jgi:hypothetical protein
MIQLLRTYGFMMAHIHQGKTGEIGQPVTAPYSVEGLGFFISFSAEANFTDFSADK